MNKPSSLKQAPLTTTTVTVESSKYLQLRKRLLDRGITFRQWIDEQVSAELARTPKDAA
ncbi:MAG TPA: hypothetical protein VM223_01105 [Planctomycetota bacterium]|nr:hypothetical protein [Planctomycetota bacterium]